MLCIKIIFLKNKAHIKKKKKEQASDLQVCISEQTLRDSEGGQGSLACCSPWDRKESDMTERLNNSFLLTFQSHLLAFSLNPRETWALVG